MQNKVVTDIRYRLIDERRHNEVTFQDVFSGEKYLISAFELARRKELICNFSPEDACHIGVIAGSS